MTPVKIIFLRLCAVISIAFFAAPTLQAQNKLIHYWSFNKTPTTVAGLTSYPAIKADYSLIDTNKALWQYALFSGTSTTYKGFYDPVSPGSDTNDRQGFTAGSAFRFRNPADSAEVRVYIPTTGYSNIVLKYALESSSTGSGDKVESFAYSTDSGLTWKNKANGLTVNDVPVDTLLTTPALYQGTSWGLVKISFGKDTTVNNNPKLVFRIRLTQLNTGTSGNNRFDNFSVEGGDVPNTIVVGVPGVGDTLYSGDVDSIRLTVGGRVSALKTVYYSPDNGARFTLAGTGTGSTFAWTVPYTSQPVSQAILEIIDSNYTVGFSRPFVIMPGRLTPPSANLIHYWHFNGFAGPYILPGQIIVYADYSTIDPSKAAIVYQLLPNVSDSYIALLSGSAGDTTNRQMTNPAGRCLQVNNPSDSIELRFYIPTTSYRDISLHYALQGGDGTVGPLTASVQYSLDSGLTWKTTALKRPVDTIGRAPFLAPGWGLVSVDLTGEALANNNPRLVYRLRFAGNNSQINGQVRIDNFSVEGTYVPPTGPPVDLIDYWHFNTLTTAYHNPGIPSLPADYSVFPSSPASLVYWLDPKASKTYGGYIDNVAPGDTSNARLGMPASNALRVRNPTDSMEMRFYISTLGYKDIHISYALQSSSVASGQLVEFFDISSDSGATWQLGAAPSLDVTPDKFQGTNWGLVQLNLSGDTVINNNPNFVFRIRFVGNTDKTSGNNRFDNICIEGSKIILPPTKRGIYVYGPSQGDTLLAGQIDTMRLGYYGAVTDTWTIECSLDSGVTWTPVGSTTPSTSYVWTVPNVQSEHAIIRVTDANKTVGVNLGTFVIMLPGSVSSVEVDDPVTKLPVTSVIPGGRIPIKWNASGWLGSSVDLDVSYDGKNSWIPILHGFGYGTGSSYLWNAPITQRSGVVIRVRFSKGATGYSQPFDIVGSGVGYSVSSGVGFSVWPNPFGESTTIQYESTGMAAPSLSIRDILGREVAQYAGTIEAPGTHDFRFNASQLIPGTYSFIFTSGDRRYQGKLCIVR